MTARQFRWALELTGEGFEIADATALYGENSDPEIQNLDAGERTITLLTSPQLDTQIGWPAKDILDHFTCSAQVYRHSPAKWPQGYSPANAMHLREATQFIQSCAATWLAWRFP